MKKLWPFLLILILSIPAVISLLQPGAYTSHDFTHHIIRQIVINDLLHQGQLPPLWSASLNHGFGYPLFIFNYPLPGYIGFFFSLFGLDPVISLKLIFFLSLPLSALGMYLFLDSLFPKRTLAAILGSLFYLYAPIRFLIVYVSAAVGTALSLAVVPFLFWSITLLIKTHQKKYFILTSFLTFTLILSHNVTVLIFAPLLLFFPLFYSFTHPKTKTSLIYLSLAAILGFGLAAYFWLPAIFEKQFIRYDSVMAGFYQDHFPSFTQLLHSPWGYGLSHPGTDQDGMSFQIGLPHLIVLLVSILFFFKYKPRQKALYLLIFSIFLFSVFIMLPQSQFVWQHLPLLQLTQFPFRFLALSVFSLSLIVALFFSFFKYPTPVFIFLIALLLYGNRNHLRINQVFNPPLDYYYEKLPTTTTASWSEHSPSWFPLPTSQSPAKISAPAFVKINYLSNQDNLVQADITSTSSASIIFNQAYFPGWTFYLDNNVVNFDYQSKASPGLPVINLPAGDHQFTARFQTTSDRRLADLISLISLFILFLSLIPSRFIAKIISK